MSGFAPPVPAAAPPWPVAGASAERPRPELARPIRKARAIRTATFPRWNRVLLPTRLLGSESDLTVCEARVTQNPQSVPWVGGAVENGSGKREFPF
jgi:hypothetical protein